MDEVRSAVINAGFADAGVHVGRVDNIKMSEETVFALQHFERIETHLDAENPGGGGRYRSMAMALLGSHELTAAPTAITFGDGEAGGVRQATVQYRVAN